LLGDVDRAYQQRSDAIFAGPEYRAEVEAEVDRRLGNVACIDDFDTAQGIQRFQQRGLDALVEQKTDILSRRLDGFGADHRRQHIQKLASRWQGMGEGPFEKPRALASDRAIPVDQEQAFTHRGHDLLGFAPCLFCLIVAAPQAAQGIGDDEQKVHRRQHDSDGLDQRQVAGAGCRGAFDQLGQIVGHLHQAHVVGI